MPNTQNQQPHLSEEQITGFVRASLPAAELLDVSDHASECADCQTRLSRALRLGPAPGWQEEPAFHLSYEQMRDHLGGSLDKRDQSVVHGHVQHCDICREELHDLAQFKADLETAGASREQTVEKSAQTCSPQVWQIRPSFTERFRNWWRQVNPRWMVLGGMGAAAAIIALFAFIGTPDQGVPQRGGQNDDMLLAETTRVSDDVDVRITTDAAPLPPPPPNGGHLDPSPFDNPSSVKPQTHWEPIDTHRGELFPCLELARLGENEKRTAKDTGPNALGAWPNSPYGALVQAPAGTKVRLQICCDELMEPSSIEVTIEKADEMYGVVAPVKWKAAALRACTQKHEVEVTWKLSLGGALVGSEVSRTVTVHPVDILPLSYTFISGKNMNLYHYAAAYVNENHPKLDPILTEARNTHVVDDFPGMKSGDPAQVKDQVLAIWWALQKRGIVYHDISEVELPKDSVFFAQRVRFFEDVIDAQKANCIDGTLVLASLLSKIGLEPVICIMRYRDPNPDPKLYPDPKNAPWLGHAILGFYLDKENKQMAYLETTALNKREYYVEAKRRAEARIPRLPLGIFPDSETQTCPTTIDVAREMFELAMETGGELEKLVEEQIKAGENAYFYRIDLNETRKTVAPIPSP